MFAIRNQLTSKLSLIKSHRFPSKSPLSTSTSTYYSTPILSHKTLSHSKTHSFTSYQALSDSSAQTINSYEAFKTFLDPKTTIKSIPITNPDSSLAQSNYKFAIQYFSDLYQTQVKQLGHEHEEVASTLRVLANYYKASGELETALFYFKKFHDTIQNICLLYENPLVATAITEMATCYSDLGQNEEALEYFLEAHELWKKIFGKCSNMQVLYTAYALGHCYTVKGNHLMAAAYYLELIEKLNEKLENQPHFYLVSAYLKLAKAQINAGDKDAGLETLLVAQKMSEKLFPNDEGVEYAQVAKKISEINLMLNIAPRALNFAQLAHRLTESIYGDLESVELIESHNLLAKCLLENGKVSLAEEEAVKARNMLEKLYGSKVVMLKVENEELIGRIALKKGRTQEALKIFTAAFEDMKKVKEYQNLELFYVLSKNIQDIYNLLGEKELAYKIEREEANFKSRFNDPIQQLSCVGC